MSFWKKTKQAAIVNRLIEEKLYERVLNEIESGFRRDGLWAKALQKSRGNEQEAKGHYIEFRVQSIKDEAEIAGSLTEEDSFFSDAFSTEGMAKPSLETIKPIDKYDKDGYTPLMRAVKEMDIDSVIDLLERGANPKIKDENFGTSTALTMAKLILARAKTDEDQKSHQKIVEVLELVS